MAKKSPAEIGNFFNDIIRTEDCPEKFIAASQFIKANRREIDVHIRSLGADPQARELRKLIQRYDKPQKGYIYEKTGILSENPDYFYGSPDAYGGSPRPTYVLPSGKKIFYTNKIACSGTLYSGNRLLRVTTRLFVVAGIAGLLYGGYTLKKQLEMPSSFISKHIESLEQFDDAE